MSATAGEWVRLGTFDELGLEPGSARRVEAGGQRVALVRIGDDVYAIGDRCSHADYSLAEGEVDVDACTLECPKHGSAFGLTDGVPRSLPAIRPVPVHEVRVDDDRCVLLRLAADPREEKTR